MNSILAVSWRMDCREGGGQKALEGGVGLLPSHRL